MILTDVYHLNFNYYYMIVYRRNGSTTFVTFTDNRSNIYVRWAM